MGQGNSTPAPPAAEVGKQKKLGIKTGKPICCCCPDTKKARDECIVFRGEESEECKKLIEAHKMCLRDEGFDVK
eukprot:scaffold5517_cov135-Cylindrotheca_fusiformis.AAC.7